MAPPPRHYGSPASPTRRPPQSGISTAAPLRQSRIPTSASPQSCLLVRRAFRFGVPPAVALSRRRTRPSHPRLSHPRCRTSAPFPGRRSTASRSSCLTHRSLQCAGSVSSSRSAVPTSAPAPAPLAGTAGPLQLGWQELDRLACPASVRNAGAAAGGHRNTVLSAGQLGARPTTDRRTGEYIDHRSACRAEAASSGSPLRRPRRCTPPAIRLSPRQRLASTTHTPTRSGTCRTTSLPFDSALRLAMFDCGGHCLHPSAPATRCRTIRWLAMPRHAHVPSSWYGPSEHRSLLGGCPRATRGWLCAVQSTSLTRSSAFHRSGVARWPISQASRGGPCQPSRRWPTGQLSRRWPTG
jgi:hypothetical protein